MTDADLEILYKKNIDVSHFAALRGIFDAGYAMGAGTGVPTVDQSAAASAATAAADDPAVTTV